MYYVLQPINVLIEYKNISFEIDSGSLHSVMLMKLYNNNFNYIIILMNDIELKH